MTTDEDCLRLMIGNGFSNPNLVYFYLPHEMYNNSHDNLIETLWLPFPLCKTRTFRAENFCQMVTEDGQCELEYN